MHTELYSTVQMLHNIILRNISAVHRVLCKKNLQTAAKSSPLKFFAVFTATVWNFKMKF